MIAAKTNMVFICVDIDGWWLIVGDTDKQKKSSKCIKGKQVKGTISLAACFTHLVYLVILYVVIFIVYLCVSILIHVCFWWSWPWLGAWLLWSWWPHEPFVFFLTDPPRRKTRAVYAFVHTSIEKWFLSGDVDVSSFPVIKKIQHDPVVIMALKCIFGQDWYLPCWQVSVI